MILRVSCSGGERGLDSSTWLRAEMAILQRDSRRRAGMRERAHFLSAARVCLSSEAREAAKLGGEVGRCEAQTEEMISRQGCKLAQADSNLKKFERRIVVVTWMMRGT